MNFEYLVLSTGCITASMSAFQD